MTSHDNGPTLDGWQLPPRCCGTWAKEHACSICGQYVRDVPPNITLSDN